MKRIMDICVSFILLVLCSPILVVASILIKRKLGSPVLFTQNRSGKNGDPFRLIKFRSMTDECDAQGNLLPDDQRLPAFGQLLRSTSIDELPTLWNVLKGDMSLIGPRPLLIEYVPLYDEEQKRRLDVKPGITGWAQINGRNSISWEEKFKHDCWYVDNQSLWLDFKILLGTVKKVLVRDGISAKGEVTMPRFTGSSK